MSQYTGGYSTDGCTSPACSAALGAGSSLSQGETFARMTRDFHGGGSGRRTTRRMRGGGGASYPEAFSELLPVSLHAGAGIASQDAAFAALPQFAGKYGMSGGKRNSRKASRKNRKTKSSRKASRKNRKNSRKNRKNSRKASRKNRKSSRKASRKNRKNSRKSYRMRGGMAPVDAPSMILSPSEEPAAFLNPQWYTENQVVPSFRGPANAYAASQAPQYTRQIPYGATA